MISLKNAEGRELIWQNPTGEDWGDHAPILFPICGSIKNSEVFYKGKSYPLGQHGFALRSEFSLIEKTEEKIVFKLCANEKTKAVYPFDFCFTAAYSLDGEKITFAATVENTGNDILPYSFGWHPGFILFTDGGQDIEDYSVKFDNKKEVTWVRFYEGFDTPSDYLPYPTPNSEYKLCEKEIYSHDTMIFRGAGNTARLMADGHPYELTMTWSENIPVLCLWKSDIHASKFICIEPWTHDVIVGEKSNHLSEREAHRIAPGEKEDFEYTLKFKF